MSDRLTDADLRELALRFPTHLGEPKLSVLIQMALTEIRTRRAADLTGDQIGIIDQSLEIWSRRHTGYVEVANRIRRLLAGGGK